MSTYTELDEKLASLLGWTNVRESRFFGNPRLGGTFEGKCEFLPRWAEDDGAAFKLMVEYCVDVVFYDGESVNSFIEGNPQGALCEFVNFENKEQAVRRSVVNSVIMKLGVQ